MTMQDSFSKFGWVHIATVENWRLYEHKLNDLSSYAVMNIHCRCSGYWSRKAREWEMIRGHCDAVTMPPIGLGMAIMLRDSKI